jgi:hypothetical protein
VTDITISNDKCNTEWDLLFKNTNTPLNIIQTYIQPLFKRQEGLKGLDKTQKTVRQINRVMQRLPKLKKIGEGGTPWTFSVSLTRCDQEKVDLWQLMTSKEDYNVESFWTLPKNRLKEKNETTYLYIVGYNLLTIIKWVARSAWNLIPFTDAENWGKKEPKTVVNSSWVGPAYVLTACQRDTKWQIACKKKYSHFEGKHHTLIHQPKSTETKVNIVNEEFASEDEFDDESKITVNMRKSNIANSEPNWQKLKNVNCFSRYMPSSINKNSGSFE